MWHFASPGVPLDAPVVTSVICFCDMALHWIRSSRMHLPHLLFQCCGRQRNWLACSVSLFWVYWIVLSTVCFFCSCLFVSVKWLAVNTAPENIYTVLGEGWGWGVQLYSLTLVWHWKTFFNCLNIYLWTVYHHRNTHFSNKVVTANSAVHYIQL